jgi:exonuclease SbcC
VRPRRLELHGFTAFREPQTIDLTDFELFVITGPTGAGKTSLLDAMALALYGQVPRMGKQGLGQLVSHGMAEARVLLEFEVDGDVFRVSRRLPRSGSQSGRLERRVGERWVEDVERGGITAVGKRVLELVTLDFESFCKAILLPQGECARFLKGDPAERRKTLANLLGLQVYERMGATARERIKTLKIKGENTRAILDEQFADATPGALIAAEQAIDAAREVEARAAETLASARTLDAARTIADAQRATAERLAVAFAALAGELESEVGECRAAEASHRNATADREAAAVANDQASEERAAAEHRESELVAAGGDRETLVRLISAVEQMAALTARVGAAEVALADAESAQTALADEVSRRAEEEVAAKTELATSASTDEKAADSLRLAHAESSALADAAAAAQRALTERDEAASELADFESQLADADADTTRAREKQLEAGRRRAELEDEHVVATLVAGLTVGDPCPVCARPLAEHPHIDPAVDEQLTAAGTAADAAHTAAERARQGAADARASRDAGSTRLARAEEELAAALGEDGAIAALETRAARASETAERAAVTAAEATRGKEAAAVRAHDASVELARATAKRDAAAEVQAAAAQALATARTEEAHARALLRERFGETIPPDASDQLAAARDALIAAEKMTTAARETERTARAELDTADEALRAAVAAVAELDVRHGTLHTRAEALLAELATAAVDVELPGMPSEMAGRDSRAKALAGWCTTASAILGERAAVLAKRSAALGEELIALATALELPADSISAALAAVAGAADEARDGRVRAEAAHTRLGEQVAQREQLEAQIAADMTRIKVLDVLATELKADHFIEFIVQETLDLLAMHASDELVRISDNRYRLASKDGDFFVIDQVNADEQRSVRTLSGGETFMASLALALALSQHVSELAGEGLGAHLEAVFIDEGFGALDPESLEEVIDALERLRDDELLVGVISHVPALAERIRIGLEVRKDGNRSMVVPVR